MSAREVAGEEGGSTGAILFKAPGADVDLVQPPKNLVQPADDLVQPMMDLVQPRSWILFKLARRGRRIAARSWLAFNRAAYWRLTCVFNPNPILFKGCACGVDASVDAVPVPIRGPDL
jgi:hypothetical protein